MGLILFDIDGTLFDPRRFGQLYRAGLVEALGTSEEELAAATADYYSTLESSTDFDPNSFVENISQRFGVDIKVIEDIFWKPQYFEQSMFDEAPGVLEKLSHGNQLGVFSQGQKYYQEYKLEHMGILKYFDPSLIFIYKRKMAEEASGAIPEGATIIEDKHDVALHLSKITKTIWINRMSDENDPQMETIHSLEHLAKQAVT